MRKNHLFFVFLQQSLPFMSIPMRISKIKYFFSFGMWRMQPGDHSTPLRVAADLLRKVYLSLRFFIGRGHTDYAPSLSFSTLLAIVPVVAAVFAIAKGFGLAGYIEQWLHKALTSQPQVVDWIIQLSNSYLDHAKTGVVIGIGILVMLYSVMSLIYNIESAFDDIWQVKEKRSWNRVLLDYTSMLFLAPVVLILISGANIFVYGVVDSLQGYLLLGRITRLLIKVSPLVLTSAFFTLLYVFMPNTRVRFRSAVGPGILAGVAMTLLQLFYVHSQLFLSSYSAIYGSFAALPLFMLWLLISWYICLFCAELCYTNQNLDYYTYLVNTNDISQHNRLLMAAVVMGHVCRRFAVGGKPHTARSLKVATGYPMRVVADLLDELCRTNLLTVSMGPDGQRQPYYQPAATLTTMTLGRLTKELENAQQGNLRRMDIEPEKQLAAEIRIQIDRSRGDYLKALDGVMLKDLLPPEQ